MPLSVLNLSVRRILRGRRLLCIALAVLPLLATTAAHGQGCWPPSCGAHQSPIDIVDSKTVFDSTAPRFDNIADLETPLPFIVKNTLGSKWCSDGSCSGVVEQPWGTLKAYPNLPPPAVAPHIVFGGVRYNLDEFHFHAPAEHRIDRAAPTAMEVHFVFRKAAGEGCSTTALLVIGQRIAKGARNEMLDKIFGESINLPRDYHGESVKVEGLVISQVLKGLKDSYRYNGSLTSPANLGCTNPPGNPIDQLRSANFPEVVSWVLLKDTIEMSEPQIAKFKALFSMDNARQPQALRQVVKRTFKSN